MLARIWRFPTSSRSLRLVTRSCTAAPSTARQGWPRHAHQELQSFMTNDLHRTLWSLFAVVKLYWRVDDVEPVLREKLDKFFARSEKELYHLTPPNVPVSGCISAMRHQALDRVSHLAMSAQYSLLRNLTIQGLGIASSLALNAFALTLYSAGSIGILALVWGLYRLQQDWTMQRHSFEGFVREAARGAIDQAWAETASNREKQCILR